LLTVGCSDYSAEKEASFPSKPVSAPPASAPEPASAPPAAPAPAPQASLPPPVAKPEPKPAPVPSAANGEPTGKPEPQIEIAGPIESRPASVYNLELHPLKERDPVVIASGQRVDARFSIGPPRAQNILPQVEIDQRIEKMAAGLKAKIDVQMVCEVCVSNATQNRVIEFDPRTRQSTETVFHINADPDLKGRLGRIYFLLSMTGRQLNHIEVVAFVDEAAPATVGYSLPSIRFLPLPSDPGDPPDLVISVTRDSTRGTLAVTLKPELKALDAALNQLTWDAGAKAPRKFEVPAGAVTKELENAARAAYGQLRQMTNPDRATRGRLAALYKAAGSPVYQGGFPSDPVRLIPAHRDEALSVFKSAGQRLYRALFTEYYGADPALMKALDVVENFRVATGRALRISVTTEFYLPWQMLYPTFADNEKFSTINATRFWGFKYELTVRQIVAGQKNSQERGPLRPGAANVVFAKGRGRGANDPVEALADELVKALYRTATPPAQRKIVTSRSDFISALEAGSNDLMLVFLFSHATSGSYTVFSSERPATFTDDMGPRIEFGEKDDWVRPDTIDDIYNRLGALGLPIWKQQPIFVLNACETGTGGGDPGNSGLFVETLSRLGASSVVVTESEVWAAFAKEWAVSFIRELRLGNDMPRAVRNARVYHLQQHRNPMGLLYAVYGSSGARILMPRDGL
jgi:hypothetical protein